MVDRAYDEYTGLEQAAMTAWRTGILNSKMTASVCAVPHLKRASLFWDTYYQLMLANCDGIRRG
jgi:hypothetical protein